MLFITGYGVLSEAVGRIYGSGMPTVTLESFIVLAATLAINIPVAVYEYRKGKELNSPVLISDSRHTITDVFVTVAVLIGLVFMKMGYTIIDPIITDNCNHHCKYRYLNPFRQYQSAAGFQCHRQ